MKSAILLGQIENERTGKEDEEEDDERSTRLSPVYALAVHSEAMWGVSGTIVRPSMTTYDEMIVFLLGWTY